MVVAVHNEPHSNNLESRIIHWKRLLTRWKHTTQLPISPGGGCPSKFTPRLGSENNMAAWLRFARGFFQRVQGGFVRGLSHWRMSLLRGAFMGLKHIPAVGYVVRAAPKNCCMGEVCWPGGDWICYVQEITLFSLQSWSCHSSLFSFNFFSSSSSFIYWQLAHLWKRCTSATRRNWFVVCWDSRSYWLRQCRLEIWRLRSWENGNSAKAATEQTEKPFESMWCFTGETKVEKLHNISMRCHGRQNLNTANQQGKKNK